MSLSEHWLAYAGSAAAAIALMAWFADRRRARRVELDRVGIVPWTDVSFWSMMAAVLLLGAAFKSWLGG